MKSRMSLVFILMLSALGLPPGSVAAQDPPETTTSAIADHMHQHLARISSIKSSIIAGDLEAVREPATWLAEHETIPGLPEDWQSFIDQMREYARQVAKARNLTVAAESVSEMARTCGTCHLVNGLDFEFGYDSKPREDLEDVVVHMQRHQWAADRLWEGLIGPSDIAWKRGTDMLIDVPLRASKVTQISVYDDEIKKIEHRVHALGGRGTQTKTPISRSELYGEFLSLCASCHTLLDRGPGH